MRLGRNPALIVVDLAVGFANPNRPLGFDLSSEIKATNVLLAAAREAGIPAIFSTVAYDPTSPVADVWLEKIPDGHGLIAGSPAVEIDPGWIDSRAIA